MFQNPLTLDRTQIRAVKFNVLYQRSLRFAPEDLFFSLYCFPFWRKTKTSIAGCSMVTKPLRVGFQFITRTCVTRVPGAIYH